MALFKDKHAQDTADFAKLMGWVATGIASVAAGTSLVNVFTKAGKKTVNAIVTETVELKETVKTLVTNNNNVTDSVEKLESDRDELKAKVTNLETDVFKLKTEVTEEQAKAFADALKKIKVKS